MFNRDEARSLAVSADGNERYLSREIRRPPLPPPPRYSFNKQARGYTRVQIIEHSLALSRTTVLCR